jgi:hypothetical protein
MASKGFSWGDMADTVELIMQRGVREHVAALQSEADAIGRALLADRERCRQEDQQARAEFDSGMRRRIPGYTPPNRRPFAYALDGVRRG